MRSITRPRKPGAWDTVGTTSSRRYLVTSSGFALSVIVTPATTACMAPPGSSATTLTHGARGIGSSGELDAGHFHGPTEIVGVALKVFRAVYGSRELYDAYVRAGMGRETALDPAELFAHVYSAPTPQLREQAALLAAELSEERA
jgi:hypothetical protein